MIMSENKKETFRFLMHKIILLQTETDSSLASWRQIYKETRFSEKLICKDICLSRSY